MYVTAIRSNVMYVVSLINRYMSMLSELHFAANKIILTYLQGTIKYGLFYKTVGNRELVRFNDNFFLSDAVMTWSSKKQPIFTLSTTEAKFVAATTCSCQLI